MTKIIAVEKKSPLKGKVLPGDEILGINGFPFTDILDYAYAEEQDEADFELRRDGKTFHVIYVRKDYSERLGLSFDESAEIVPKECCNNCIFCFVRQLPDNLRETLYVKDDDYRLSFISGSYITCTNLKEADFRRITEYKLSPLYVSVHATDETVRKYLLGIKKAMPVLPVLERFVSAGITVHTQIVLMPEVNDGAVLLQSLEDLYKVGVATVAVVPVGLTSHRENLPSVRLLRADEAEKAIETTERFYEEHPNFCYCADEMYQIAGKEVRDESYYGNFEQIENGVGLIAKFFGELKYALENVRPSRKKKKIGIFTGVSGESVIKKAVGLIKEKFPALEINVYPVKNRFFGETVTVTGLVTATDIIDNYKDKRFDEDYLMIPSVMLKEFGDVFLDDMSVKELSSILEVKIAVSHPDGESFLKTILKGEQKW